MNRDLLAFFLCGDVMIGRGIDQILPNPNPPRIFESYCKSALDYVQLCQRASGPISIPKPYEYVWGDIIPEIDRITESTNAARIINLETAVTSNERPWPGKGIQYRVSPDNARCLLPLRPDCVVLANNHVLDWSQAGLLETLTTMEGLNLSVAGCGRTLNDAMAPAVIDIGEEGEASTLALVFAYGTPTSGVPEEWAATASSPGVNYLPDMSSASVQRIARHIQRSKQQHQQTSGKAVLTVLSIHWGGNWGYKITAAERAFAQQLIDLVGVDIVHGHSSHHFKGIEVYKGKPIIYGCGDFLNDYEGISGHEEYRSDLGLMYFPFMQQVSGVGQDGAEADPARASFELAKFVVRPTRIRHMRVNLLAPATVTAASSGSDNREDEKDMRWVHTTLARECAAVGTRVTRNSDGTLELEWR